jgi:hypothetical protein
VDTKAITQPLVINARIGTRQRIGLRTKLITKAEVFLRKMNRAIRGLGRVKMLANCSSEVVIYSEGRLLLAGVTKPRAKPVPNKKTATIIHL